MYVPGMALKAFAISIIISAAKLVVYRIYVL